jgi:hypothetical protein
MAEPTIVCPNCQREIKLTESLAAPLVEATRRDFNQRLDCVKAEMAERESAVCIREEQLVKAREAINSQVEDKLKCARAQIEADAAARAKRALAGDIDQKAKEIAELQDVLKQREGKLAEAQKAQAELIRKQRELDDARREFELTVETRVQQGLEATRAQARKDAEEKLNLKVAEREQIIASMQRTIEELQRRAEQGSQQLQGEVQELELEALLKAKFPGDIIQPVPKGEHGGDVIQQVMGPMGQACGTILWESKRTKNWSDGWLPKLRADQRVAKAEFSVLVSQVLPKGVDTLEFVDDVWVTHPRAVLPVAVALRNSLIDLAAVRQANQGQQGKMEMVYQYLTGSAFRQRVLAMAEAFTSMQEDLDREKKVISKQWAKREQQIKQVMQSTVGMYGDLQGIAGKTLGEIDGLEWKALAEPDDLK